MCYPDWRISAPGVRRKDLVRTIARKERRLQQDVGGLRQDQPDAKWLIRRIAMKLFVGALAVAFALSASGASAQTSQPNAANAPSSQNSGTGIAGQPGNKNGPAGKPGDTVGSSSGTNSTVQQQDTSSVKGLPGSKSGPAAKKPDRK